MSETLLNEIRATKPEAPSALRERVRALSVQEPVARALSRPASVHWGWRRLVLAVAGRRWSWRSSAAGGDRADSRRRATGGDRSAASGAAEAADLLRCDGSGLEGCIAAERRAPALAPAAKDAATGSAIAPAPGPAPALRGGARASASTTSMRSRTRPSSAQQIAHDARRQRRLAPVRRSVGGRGHRPDHAAHPDRHRSQSALAELSQLGTIVGQRYGIQDLQQQADSLADPDRGRPSGRIAQILTQLGERDPLEREPRRAPVAAGRGPPEAGRPARVAAEHARRSRDLDRQRHPHDRGDRGGPASAASRLDGIKDVLAWEAIAAPLLARRRRPVPASLGVPRLARPAPSAPPGRDARLLEQN